MSVVRTGDDARAQRLAADAILGIAVARKGIALQEQAVKAEVTRKAERWEVVKDRLAILDALRFSASELVSYWQEVRIPIGDDGAVCTVADLEWAADIVAAQEQRSRTGFRQPPPAVQPLDLPLLLNGDFANPVARVRLRPDFAFAALDGAILSFDTVDDRVVALSLSPQRAESAS